MWLAKSCVCVVVVGGGLRAYVVVSVCGGRGARPAARPQAPPFTHAHTHTHTRTPHQIHLKLQQHVGAPGLQRAPTTPPQNTHTLPPPHPPHLKLQQHVGAPGLQRGHKLLHTLVVGLARDAPRAQALVPRVLQQGGGVGAHVQADGEDLVGGHPCRRSVEQALAWGGWMEGGWVGAWVGCSSPLPPTAACTHARTHAPPSHPPSRPPHPPPTPPRLTLRDAHPPCPQVPQPQDALAVCHHHHAHVLGGQRAQAS